VLVAFYRKTALDAIGGLAGFEDEAVAGIDLALALCQAGFRCVSERKCLTAAAAETLAGPGPWLQGVQAERLFWRWAARPASVRAIAGHVAVLALECLQCLLQPTLLCRLAGRAWASVHFDLHHQRRADQQTRRPTETVPRPHFVGGLSLEPHRASTRCSS
jgi:hypothetical protein